MNIIDEITSCNLSPVFPKYRIVFEASEDSTCEIVRPNPWWLAAAMHGGLLPPSEDYDKLIVDGKKVINTHVLYDRRLPALTEEEAMEELAKRTVPKEVLNYRGNRRKLLICPVECIPTDRQHRNAWRIKQ